MPPPSGISYGQGLQNKTLASRSNCCKLANDNEIGHGNQINSIINDDSIGQQSTPNANLAVKAKRLNNKRRQRRRKQRTTIQVVSIGEAERASSETGPVCDDLTMAKMGDGLSTVSNDGTSVKRLEASIASPLTSNQKLGLGGKYSDTLPRSCVPSSPRECPEVAESVKCRQCTPVAREVESTAQESATITARHEGRTLTALGNDGTAVSLNPEAAIFVPRADCSSQNVGNHGNDRDMECHSQTSRQTLFVPESDGQSRVEDLPTMETNLQVR
jgi:hypothetical protein